MHLFQIKAIDDPQSLPRIAGLFAQRGITPLAMRMAIANGHMCVDLTVEHLEETHAAIIAAKLQEMFAVSSVKLELDALFA